MMMTKAFPALGKRAPRIDTRTLRFANYRRKKIFAPPPIFASYVTRVPSWPIYENDRLGDCVAAAAGHCVEQWSLFAGKPQLLSDADVLRFYETQGYIPGDPSTDNGMVMLQALNTWRRHGIGGHKISAYVSLNPKDSAEIREAVYLFGNVFLGLALPVSAQEPGFAWTVADGGPYGDGSPGSWGGHCVPIVAYSDKSFTVVTWGETLKMSYNFLHDYADEAYAVLSEDWIAANGEASNHFNFAQLKSDLSQITN